MKSGLKYLIMLFLFVGSISSEVIADEMSAAAFDSSISSISEVTTPDSAKQTFDLPAILFHGMVAGDNNYSFSSLKIHTHLLCNIKEHKKTLYYSSHLRQDIVEGTYVLPLEYYIYALEKIVI